MGRASNANPYNPPNGHSESPPLSFCPPAFVILSGAIAKSKNPFLGSFVQRELSAQLTEGLFKKCSSLPRDNNVGKRKSRAKFRTAFCLR